MFTNLNPLDRPTAILEIAIMLLGAALIGFFMAWILRKPKKAGSTIDTAENTTSKSKIDPRIAQLEKAVQVAYLEKSKLENESKAQLQQAKETENVLRSELESVKASQKQGGSSPAANEKNSARILELETTIQNLGAQLSEQETKWQEQMNREQLSNDELRKTIADKEAQIQAMQVQQQATIDQLIQATAQKNTELEATGAAQVQSEASKDDASSIELVRLAMENDELRAQLAAFKAISEHSSELELIALRAEIQTLKSNSAVPVTENDRIRELERGNREHQRNAFNLQAEIAKLRNEKASSGTNAKELDWLKREKEDLERDVKDLEGQIERLEKENGELRSLARDKTAAGPVLDKLTKERDRLKAELDRLKKGASEPIIPITADFSHLGTATTAEKDDFTRINGIGPVVEGKLNQLGIYTYAQISRFSPADMDMIDNVLQLFPGRVQRENWVSQAAAFELASNR